MRGVTVSGLLLLSLGCGSSHTPTDGGARMDGGAPDEDAGENLCDAVLTPCPAGWREVVGVGELPLQRVCDPWPETGDEECTGATMHLPGRPGCEPVGSECPPGRFATDLPADAPVFFVEPGGSGDGTRSRPFGNIANAMFLSPDGATLALARGSYAEVVEVMRPFTLHGACAAETIISPRASPVGPPSAVSVGAGPVALIDLSVVTTTEVGVSADAADLRIEGVAVLGAGVGFGATGLSNLQMRQVLAREGSVGLELVQSDAVVSEAAFERLDLAGILVNTAFALTLTDAVVRDVANERFDVLPRGIDAQLGATTTLRRVALERVQGIGVLASELDSVSIEDVRFADIPQAACADTSCGDAPTGIAVGAFFGAHVEMGRFLIERSALCGVMLDNDGEMDLTHGVVSDSTIGACIQTDRFEVSRLTDHTCWTGNVVNLDSEALPPIKP